MTAENIIKIKIWFCVHKVKTSVTKTTFDHTNIHDGQKNF